MKPAPCQIRKPTRRDVKSRDGIMSTSSRSGRSTASTDRTTTATPAPASTATYPTSPTATAATARTDPTDPLANPTRDPAATTGSCRPPRRPDGLRADPPLRPRQRPRPRPPPGPRQRRRREPGPCLHPRTRHRLPPRPRARPDPRPRPRARQLAQHPRSDHANLLPAAVAYERVHPPDQDRFRTSRRDHDRFHACDFDPAQGPDRDRANDAGHGQSIRTHGAIMSASFDLRGL